MHHDHGLTPENRHAAAQGIILRIPDRDLYHKTLWIHLADSFQAQRGLASVARPVVVPICLVLVRDRGTIVAGVSHDVIIRILLERIEHHRAVIARAAIERESGVALTITVGVGTGIAQIARTVPVRVALQRIGPLREREKDFSPSKQGNLHHHDRRH